MTAGTEGSIPRWWPAGVYYGWALVGTLGVTATVSYGILSYAFALFITPMGRELGWSQGVLTGGFAVASLIAGLAATPVGRWVDRHGARGVMTAGAALATGLLLAWSRVESVPVFYAIWAAMGVAMAMVLYEPAFAVIATWFRGRRGQALTLLTFIGGFASVVFVPVAAWLIGRHGWREALVWLAVIYAPLTVLPHAFVLRRHPSDLGLVPEGETLRGPEGPDIPAEVVFRTRAFRYLALGFGLASLATSMVTVHLVPLLIERGHSSALAAAALAALGVLALPGRLVFTPLGGRWPRSRVTASIFVLQMVAALCLLVSNSVAAVWIFVALVGAGWGAITPARAALTMQLFGGREYGRIAGRTALVVAVARALGPVSASWIYMAFGGGRHGYDLVLAVVFVLGVGAGCSILAAGDTGGAEATLSGPTPSEAYA